MSGAAENGGRRVYYFRDPEDLLPGEYGCWRGQWVAISPGGHLCDLYPLEVTEHGNGTITVQPLIEVEGTRWALTRGEWRQLSDGEAA